MRKLRDDQGRLRFFEPTLKETRKAHSRYERISDLLDRSPEIIHLVHRDLNPTAKKRKGKRAGRSCKYSADSILRALLVKAIEGLSLREATVRIDECPFLREFTRFHAGDIVHYSVLDRLKNLIRPETWQEINQILVATAVANGDEVSGEELRIDTTAVETNIHHPTDSTLLWDSYRVLGRLIGEVRKVTPEVVGKGRLHPRRVKRDAQRISRFVGKKNSRDRMKTCYERMLKAVRRIQDWAGRVATAIDSAIRQRSYVLRQPTLIRIADEIRHYMPLIDNVVDQAERRVIAGESVPNDDKIFSIFEPHTELLKRGKSWRSIEYGHMVQIEQVRSKLITGYEVFAKRPAEPDLLRASVERHRATFGEYPELVATDKGYSEKESIAELEQLGIRTAIPRKGASRDEATTEREHSVEFRAAQAFRAGIEGTIAFLKSGLGLRRCLDKGWKHFVAAVGLSVLTHNLIQLAT